MKRNSKILIMFRLFRFLLYCFAVFIGVAGLLEGGLPLLQYAIERLEGKYFDAYALLSSYDRFSSEVILILSLMLLILVHIGHVLTGGLSFAKPENPVLSRKQQADSPLSAGLTSQSLGPSGAPEQTGKETADEKLTRLLRH